MYSAQATDILISLKFLHTLTLCTSFDILDFVERE